jgi:ABC-type glycerol-3-phosphate transport system substrate-binding protein
MGFTKRRVALLLVAVLLVVLFKTRGQAAPGPVLLHIWDFSMEQVAFHKQVAEEYHRLHPNITIEWRGIVQAQYNQALPLAFQSKQAPDIFYWTENGPNALKQLLAQGWVRPLSPDGNVPDAFLKRWPKGSFLEGIHTQGGKVYGFQFADNLYWGPGYMYLNKAVFGQAGLDPSKAAPKTWSELRQVCAQIKAKTDKYCMAVPMKGLDFQRLWYALASGSMTDLFFDYKKGRFDLDDPALLRTFAFVQELHRAGYIAPGVNDKDFSRQQFAANQAAIYMDGPWMVSVWNQVGFDSSNYVIARHPDPDPGLPHGSLARQYSGNRYWVSAQTQHPQEVWEFIQWMTEPEGYFVRNYLKNAFGTVAFADNKKYLSDPGWGQIFKIAEAPGFRVWVPEPLLKCPDLANSRAYVDAVGQRNNWEYEAMVSALVNNKDLAPEASELVATRQRVIEAQLQKEAAQGLKVSIECYRFLNWEYTRDFKLTQYPRP